MAEAREESGGSTSLEDELSCPICLCLYKNPVSLSCGHNFCKKCIQKALGAQQQSKAPYACPMCKLQLGPILELQKNFQLCSIVEAFEATISKRQKDECSGKGKKMVPCDFCLDQSQPAVKTCLICEASLCQAHLIKHNTKASQQDHVLVEVDAGTVADRKCQEHGKVLECYCQDEGLYICVLCSIAGRHKGHSIITLKEAHAKKMDELSDMETLLEERKSALATALEGLWKSEQQLKTNTKTVTSQLQKLFEEMKTEMIQKSIKVLNDIQSNEKKQLSDFTKAKKEMERSRDEAAQLLQSLQKMKEQTDSFLFFKEFQLTNDRFKSQNFSVNRMDVSAMQMDKARIDSYRHLRQDFMSRLDFLLQSVQSELNNQIKQNSGEEVPILKPNRTTEHPERYPFNAFFGNHNVRGAQQARGAAQPQQTRSPFSFPRAQTQQTSFPFQSGGSEPNLRFAFGHCKEEMKRSQN